MKENKKLKAFRLHPDTAKRLDWASEMGLNQSELVDQVLLKYLKPALEEAKARQNSKLKRILAEAVP